MATTKISNSGLVSAKYNALSADNNYMETIASTTLTGSASTITFSNIPQGYKHLQVRHTVKASVDDQDVWVNFNGDTGSNYSEHRIYANQAATIVSGGATSTSKIEYFGRTGAGANVFGANIVDILDYSNSNKNKTIRGLLAWDNNSSSFVMYTSGCWYNTAPITSMVIQPQSGTFSQYSRFSLYGIKG